MKQRVKKICAIVATIGLLSNTVQAQEKILEVQNQLDSYSVVRETRDHLWMVYNYNFGQSIFSLVDENQSVAPQLWIGNIAGTDSLRVNDFEIFQDTIYFCGQVWRKEISSAIWGYFPRTGFPNVNIYYHEADLNTFSAIDVFSVDTTTIDLHVVMIGSYYLSPFYSGNVYDEVRIAPNTFSQYKSPIYDFFNRSLFYDVAVTEKKVAISSSYDVGSVLFFIKPTAVCTTLFLPSVENIFLADDRSTDIKLEHCTHDTLVAVYRSMFMGSSFLQYGDLYVQRFSAPTMSNLISIDNTSTLTPIDVKYDKRSEDLEVLASYVNLSHRSDSSMIYHLGPSQFSIGGPLFCHKYMYEKLNSIENLSSKKNSFVASGHNVGLNHLRLYRYRYDNWGGCTNYMIENTKKLQIGKEPEYVPVEFTVQEIEMIKLVSYDMERPLKVECKWE